MSLTREWQRLAIRGAVVSLLVGLTALGCGERGAESAFDPGASATQTSSTPDDSLPPQASELLRRNGVELGAGSFDDGAMSREETVAAFSKVYDLAAYDPKPSPYAATVRASDDGAFTLGETVRVMYVHDYVLDRPVPTPAPGTEIEVDSNVRVDLFAIFDAQTGEHLGTVYVALDSNDQP